MSSPPVPRLAMSAFASELRILEHRLQSSCLTDLETVEQLFLNQASHSSHFKFLRIVGKGCSALVFAARCTLPDFPCPDTEYGVKVMFNLGISEEEMVVQTSAELTMLAKLEHKGIVRLLAAFVSEIDPELRAMFPPDIAVNIWGAPGAPIAADGRVFTRFAVFDLHTEDLGSLRQRLDCMPYPDFLRHSIRLSSVLSYLLSRPEPVVHLDLKLNNILVTAKGDVCLCDFGNAVHVVPGLSVGPELIGNVAHMCPELRRRLLQAAAEDSPTLFGKVDWDAAMVFALGVVLYEMVAGVHPLPQYGLERAGVEAAYEIDLSALQAEVDKQEYPRSVIGLITVMIHMDYRARPRMSGVLGTLERLMAGLAESVPDPDPPLPPSSNRVSVLPPSPVPHAPPRAPTRPPTATAVPWKCESCSGSNTTSSGICTHCASPQPVVAVVGPSMPAMVAPSRPAVVVPSMPAMVAPSRPAVVVPSRPAVVAPSRPAVVVPSRPAVDAPSRPAVVVPSRPAVVVPLVVPPTTPSNSGVLLGWVCTVCTLVNLPDARHCCSCYVPVPAVVTMKPLPKQKLSPPPPPPRASAPWECSDCGAMNTRTHGVLFDLCSFCGSPSR